LDVLVRKALGNFSQGEPQERAYRESLSEACGVLGCVGEKGLGEFFHRESHRRELVRGV